MVIICSPASPIESCAELQLDSNLVTQTQGKQVLTLKTFNTHSHSMTSVNISMCNFVITHIPDRDYDPSGNSPNQHSR